MAVLTMADREQHLEAALLAIQIAVDTYPIKADPKPLTIEDLRHARFALRAIGIDLEDLHAHWVRRILTRVSEACEEPLKPLSKPPEDRSRD